MSKLDDLIAELCPNGVEYKDLGEIATISRGGSLQKKDFCEEGFPCIHYGQIYTKFGLFTDHALSFISIDKANKQKKAVNGDIVMAVTSENIEDVCKCVVWLGEKEVAVSGHTAIIHHNQDAKYLAYYFHSSMFFSQKVKLAHGTKVIEVTPDKLNGVRVPVPPLEVQREIVRVLDNFTFLSAELSAELSARRKQYEYYRGELLNFENKETPTALLREVVDFRNGKGHEKDIDVSGKYIVVNSKFISTNGEVKKYTSKQICPLYKDDILMVMSDLPNGRALAKCFLVDQDDKYSLNQRIGAFRVKKPTVRTRFLLHVLNRNKQLLAYDNGVDQTNLKKDEILDIKIPVPAIDVQDKLVYALDHFDSICNDLNIGLPSEIEARQKQYEYYRDLLLTFAETGSTVLTDRQTDRQT
ncbi:MAG: restriction endonuclease subunit S, partial [Lachnospiraceae bacterium]|nr:restriction endonuclease subunit S [Lachnospiraceae bacterium]